MPNHRIKRGTQPRVGTLLIACSVVSTSPLKGRESPTVTPIKSAKAAADRKAEQDPANAHPAVEVELSRGVQLARVPTT